MCVIDYYPARRCGTFHSLNYISSVTPFPSISSTRSCLKTRFPFCETRLCGASILAGGWPAPHIKAVDSGNTSETRRSYRYDLLLELHHLAASSTRTPPLCLLTTADFHMVSAEASANTPAPASYCHLFLVAHSFKTASLPNAGLQALPTPYKRDERGSGPSRCDSGCREGWRCLIRYSARACLKSGASYHDATSKKLVEAVGYLAILSSY